MQSRNDCGRPGFGGVLKLPGVRAGRRTLGLAGLLLVLGWWVVMGTARAEGEYPGGYVLTPAARTPVVLLSTTGDATLYEREGEVFIDVQAVYRVHNRDKRANQVLTVAFPGYAVTEDPPQGVTLSVKGNQAPFRQAQTQWWLADVTLAPDERASMVLKYTASLGRQPLVQFRYPLDVVAQAWPGTLESARFTLAFSEPPNPQSWLRLTPETYDLTAEGITWSYDVVDPAAPIDYLFLRPSLWERLRQARQAVVAPEAGAGASVALGDIYVELANAGDASVFDRYFPLAVAAYNQAQAKAPADAAGYVALANLFRQRAERSDPPDATYLGLATNQLSAALENGVQDAGMAETVVREYATLIEAARREGDFDVANTYLHRLDGLASRIPAILDNPMMVEGRRRLAIDWARQVLNEQGAAPARAILEESLGAGAAQAPGAAFSQLTSLQVKTDTELGKRVIEITAAPREGSEGFVQSMQDALAASGGGTVSVASTQPPVIQIELPFGDAGELRQRQERLAQALGNAPEWAALRAVLNPEVLDWQRRDEGWRLRDGWEERVSLIGSSSQLGEQAAALEQAANGLDAADDLNALLAELWRAEAEVWRRLGSNSQAQFSLTLRPRPGAPMVRSWSITDGETAEMGGAATQYEPFPYVWGIAAAYGLFMLLTGLLWWQRRQAAKRRAEARRRKAQQPGAPPQSRTGARRST